MRWKWSGRSPNPWPTCRQAASEYLTDEKRPEATSKGGVEEEERDGGREGRRQRDGVTTAGKGAAEEVRESWRGREARRVRQAGRRAGGSRVVEKLTKGAGRQPGWII